jgi:hypothetical protein
VKFNHTSGVLCTVGGALVIAGLPYLTHTFTMSPPLHVHVPTFQVQGQGHLRTLDFDLILIYFFADFGRLYNFLGWTLDFGLNLYLLVFILFSFAYTCIPYCNCKIICGQFFCSQVKVFQTAQIKQFS